MSEEGTSPSGFTAALIICGCIVFFAGVGIATTHSRLVGGFLIAVPMLLLVLVIVRTPKSEWNKLSEVVAKFEHERENRPVSGPLWRLIHKLGDLFSILNFVVLFLLIGYAVYAWLR
jgi:hypothetical protein